MTRGASRVARSWLRSALVLVLLTACGERDDARPRAIAPAIGTSDRIVVPGGRVLGTHVTSFAIDRTHVTRARFEAFVRATEHVTAAEREGDGQVLELASGRWAVLRGATFRAPRGESGEPAAPDHPVTQVSLADAEAFCAWAGGRVPTEHAWERAARSGRDDHRVYPWGDDADTNGRARANTWDGVFPSANTLRDGHLFVSPVGAFPPSPLGLSDIVGNVWHWTTSPFDAGEREGDVALRGGSHLCDPDVCHGYRIDARQRATRTDRFAHVGFRCVYDEAVAER